jgi:hypothetical protein
VAEAGKLEEGKTGMRGRGINYDTGFTSGGNCSRPFFDPDQVVREMHVIAGDLHCNAVRITGDDPARLNVAARLAAAAGLEVWFSPFPCELSPGESLELVARCADMAEDLRGTGAEVVLVAGGELSLFSTGFVPGQSFADRIPNLGKAAPREVCGRLSEYLAMVAAQVRSRFGGKISYAAAPWEEIDWAPYDIVSQDCYQDNSNRDHFAADIRRLSRHGKPVAITEFGCCAYRGAADRGGMGWAIIDWAADPPRLDGDYVRDEGEQVRYLSESLEAFSRAGVDSAFWFSFAGFTLPWHQDPRRDLDLASYGVVAILDDNGSRWRRKESFRALAAAYQ